ncbi:Hypothetical protein CINCED_3A018635 [Cinara cedri]|uniref:Uncharacterized protein n=1 Tax=Cinara cedri TaxID=506608 RepID=A0A5E4M3I7_9HEMI|nr:Hypothetical protein CINCED_3A018635 [Cinara cedri]
MSFMSCNYLLIAVCCLRAALLASGCKITDIDSIKTFEPGYADGKWLWGLKEYINSYGAYEKAIKKIDDVSNIPKWEQVESNQRYLIPEKISVGIVQCHVYSVHAQCSAAVWANISLNIMFKIIAHLRVIKNDKTKSQLLVNWTQNMTRFSEILTIYLLNLSAILFDIGYAPPIWVAMVLIFCDDIKYKIESTSLLEEENGYLNQTAQQITEYIEDFLKLCKNENIPGLVLRSTNLTNDFNLVSSKLNDIRNKYESRKDILAFNEVLRNKFRVQNWFFLTPTSAPTEKPHNIRDLLTRDNWKYLGIDWNNEKNSLSKRNIKEFEEFKVKNKNWKIDTFLNTYSTINGSVNQIRMIYLTVVIRFVLINISDCDYLRQQIEKNRKIISIKPADIHSKFRKYCASILNNVQTAIDYLAGNEFLENLVPELDTFINDFGENGSNIVLGVFAELNKMSELLKVNASGYHKTNDKAMIPWDEIDINFKDEANRINDASTYTLELQKNVPSLNFEIAKTMEVSANNTWITALP